MVLLGRTPSPYQLGRLHCSFGSGNILLPTLATPVPGSLARPIAVQPTYTGPTHPVPRQTPVSQEDPCSSPEVSVGACIPQGPTVQGQPPWGPLRCGGRGSEALTFSPPILATVFCGDHSVLGASWGPQKEENGVVTASSAPGCGPKCNSLSILV